MLNISQQIAQWLVDQSIEQVFSVTGGGSMFLNQALGSHPQMHCTFMHHEQACAMAAEGYARISGKPAVVMLTTGPGSINAMNGVFGAFTDSIPMLVISGQVKRETCLDFVNLPDLRQLGDQEGPTIAMVKPICKLAHTVREPSEIGYLLPLALQEATHGRPGPVWIEIPLDIQSSSEQVQFVTPPAPQLASQLDSAATMSNKISQIVEQLQKSKRPVLIGGTGVRIADCVQQVRALIEQFGIPLATAWTHDLIESDHPLFAGRPGTIGTRMGNFSVQNSDFVLVLGSRLNIRQTSYNWQSFAKNAYIVHIDIDQAELNKPSMHSNLTVHADLAAFLPLLHRQLEQQSLPDFSVWVRWCQDIAKKYHPSVEHSTREGIINPYVFVDQVFQHLRPDDIVVCGNASACILPFQIGRLQRGQRLFSNSGSASMGHDLPAAIGAAIATKRDDSRRRVICFAGDGSIQMNIQELQTIKTHQLNVVIVILNNSGYLSIWQTHENFFGKVIGATPESGVDFPDFNQIAKAYGLTSRRVERTLGDMSMLLDNQGIPLLINAIVDPRQEFSPRIKSRVDENGKFITPELDDMHPFLSPAILDSIRQSARAIG